MMIIAMKGWGEMINIYRSKTIGWYIHKGLRGEKGGKEIRNKDHKRKRSIKERDRVFHTKDKGDRREIEWRQSKPESWYFWFSFEAKAAKGGVHATDGDEDGVEGLDSVVTLALRATLRRGASGVSCHCLHRPVSWICRYRSAA